MKPLPVALLTPEDAGIWLRVDRRLDSECETTPHKTARAADRRDAGLMLAAKERRLGHWGRVVRYTQVEPDRYRYTSFGGAVLGSMAINPYVAGYITYFA